MLDRQGSIHKKVLVSLSVALILFMCCSAMTVAAAQPSSSGTTAASAKYPPYPVNLYEFYLSSCPHCQALAPHIAALAAEYPTLHVYQYETSNDANYSLFQTFMSAYGVKFDTVPTVFVGTQAFQGDAAAPQIEAAVAQAIQNGATGQGDKITGHVVPVSAGTKNSTSSENGTLVNTQGPLPLPLFITTGIISGVNPCVFSVLIFLMGTLALTGSRRRTLAIGVTYIATVFVVFFVSALAVLQFVRIIGIQNLVLTQIGIGIFLLFVGAVSIKDFFWYNRWFSFKIPTFTKHSISALGNTGSFLAIIGLGIIATIAALPCTLGPFSFFSTTYLANMAAMQYNLYTALFAFAFIIPMIIVFVVIYGVKVGTDSAEAWRIKTARYMRLVAGVLMVAFGILLTFKLI